MASRINESWHKAHVMPKNATIEQRLEWHLQHQANCGCRPVPMKLRARVATALRASKPPPPSRRIGRH